MINRTPSRFLSWNLDFLGFSASFLCAIHCLALPFLLSIGLFGTWSWLQHPLVEGSLVGIAVLIAVPTLYRGYRQHRRQLPIWTVGIGFLFLGLSQFSPTGEHLFTATGGLFIALAHWFNWKYSKREHQLVLDC